MRIAGWFIEGFGVFKDREVRDLPAGLTVFLGANEAGKSTLLGFVRAVLFGFPRRRAGESHYPPLAGGRHGGRLFLEGPEGFRTVERFAGRNGFRAWTATGEEISETDLQRVLGGADDKLFRSVFAFSLSELESLRTLQAEEVRARISSAHLAGAGKSAREAVSALGEEMAALLRPRGAALISSLAGQIEDLIRRCRDARNEAERYPDLLRQEETHRAESAACESEVEQLVRGQQVWQSTRERQEKRRELCAGLDDRLAALAGSVEEHYRSLGLHQEHLRQREMARAIPALAPDAVEDARRWSARLAAGERNVRESRFEWESAARELARLENEPIADVERRQEALGRLRGRMADRGAAPRGMSFLWLAAAAVLTAIVLREMIALAAVFAAAVVVAYTLFAHRRAANVRSAIAEDAAVLGLAPAPTVAEVDAAAVEIARVAALRPRLDEARAGERRLRELLESAETQAASDRDEWERWRDAAGAPPLAEPGDLADLFAQREQALFEARRTEQAIDAWERPVRSWLATTETSDRLVEQFLDLRHRCQHDREIRRDIALLDASIAANPPVETENLTELLAEARRRRDEAVGRLRMTEAARMAIEQSADVAALETEIAGARADLNVAARDWLVAALGKSLVERTLAEFTRTRQPSVLRDASASFARVTAGAYEAVLQDASSASLIVIDRQGRAKKPDQLSRGTLEQLFLCLRLGLAAEFGRRNAALPLVMDDVLVNFDPARTRAMARELVQFAADRQVLLFTCHPSTAELLREIQPETKIVSLERAEEASG